MPQQHYDQNREMGDVNINLARNEIDFIYNAFQVSTQRWNGGVAKKFTFQTLRGGAKVRFVPVPS